MRENYSAWNLDINDFFKQSSLLEKNTFLTRFAILAPSSHNTQPWTFVSSREKIVICRNLARRLPVADSNDRQHFLSIGCCIENIVVAADYYGYVTKVVYGENGQDRSIVATVFLELQDKRNDNKCHLSHSILSRKTNRGKYKNESLDSNLIERIFALDNKTGMPGFSLGIPTLISFIIPTLIKYINLEKVSKKANYNLFTKFTPCVGIISTNGDSVVDWLNAGRIFERISLLLEQIKVSVSPWGAPIQIGNYYRKIQSDINVDGRPQFLFRIGFPISNARFSPRFNLSDVIK